MNGEKIIEISRRYVERLWANTDLGIYQRWDQAPLSILKKILN
jgi:hypothetical protein